MLKFLESVEHKSGWYPFENGHAQVAYRAKALKTPGDLGGPAKIQHSFPAIDLVAVILAACERMRMFLMARMFGIVISGE